MDQLKRRGFSLVSKCPLCRKDEENIEHPLLHSPMVWGIWSFLLTSVVCGSCLGAPWLIKDWFSGWNNFLVRKSERKAWRLLIFACSGQFGKKGIELCLKMKSSPSTDLEVLLSILFVLRQGRL